MEIKFTYTIREVTPLLQCNPQAMVRGEGDTGNGGRGGKPQISLADEAELHVYRSADRQICMPSSAIKKCLLVAAKVYPIKPGGRGRPQQLTNFLTHMEVDPWEWVLLEDAKGAPVTEYEVDARRAVLASGSAITAVRPRIEAYRATFTLKLDSDLFPVDDPDKQLRELIADAGVRIGWGAYRPERVKGFGGPFGKFALV